MLEPKPGSRDEGLVAVLLEKHPLKNHSELLPVFGKIFRPLCEVGEDRVGLGEHKAIIVEHRRAAVRVDLEKFRGTALAFQNIDFDRFTRHAEMREQQADFVGVAGVRDVVELHDQ